MLVDLSVDQRHQQRPSDLLHALERLVVIVDVDHAHRETLLVLVAECAFQRCLVKQIPGDQEICIPGTLDHLVVVHDVLDGDPLHLENILALLKGDLYLGILLKFKLFLRDRRKYRGDRLAIAFLLVYHPLKRRIHPYDPAVIIHQHMGKRQIPQQCSLDLSVLCCKIDKFIHNDGSVSI